MERNGQDNLYAGRLITPSTLCALYDKATSISPYLFLKGNNMFKVFDGDLFLFECIAEEADMYRAEGYRVVQ